MFGVESLVVDEADGIKTTGTVASIDKFLLAPSDLAAPGLTNVLVALFPETSLIVPPFRAKAVVER